MRSVMCRAPQRTRAWFPHHGPIVTRRHDSRIWAGSTRWRARCRASCYPLSRHLPHAFRLRRKLTCAAQTTGFYHGTRWPPPGSRYRSRRPRRRNPAPTPTAPLSAAAEGRRTLSTAFVRVGPEGHLTVELRDGRVLTLRDVVMRADDYCGVRMSGAKYCGGYSDVAAARPGAALATPGTSIRDS